uniref:Transposase IS4-like domain-containing protein n=1 Tax=Rhodococcus sp. NS1 TaxID=402236 RepID=A0A097SQK2_9NOCA|nr:hypothetical protein LRS1606.384 [Rhodococcus sp. NS1]
MRAVISIPRIARHGVDSRECFGRYRWKIEHTFAWLTGYPRMTLCYGRHGKYFPVYFHLSPR